MKARFAVVGGFLGAGKTTALVRLAKALHDRGRRVGLITNDQAANLIDTETLRVRGFRVEEVAGACFCCKFDDLAEAAERLRREAMPDWLLGEPVGSCTDLVATVVRPLAKFYGDRYRIAPYSVLLDPRRARQIVLEKGFGGFSPKVAYIFQKQLEEADLICINKVDLLAGAEREALRAAVEAEYRRARVLLTSAVSGEGFEEWRTLLEAGEESGANIAEVDYDTYAEGEAELGWLNASIHLESVRPFDPGEVARALVEAIAAALAARGAEVAHLKSLVETEGGAAVANFVGAGSPVFLSQPPPPPASRGRLVVNARVHFDPVELREAVDGALEAVLRARGIRAAVEEATQFRPGRPVPIHRFAPAP